MSFWSGIMGWLGFGPAVEAPAAPPAQSEPYDESDPAWEPQRETGGPASGAAGTATAEAEDGETDEPSLVPEDAWWRTNGNSILEPPRFVLTDAADLSLFKEVQTFIEDPDIDLPHLPHIPQRVLTLLRQPNINYPGIGKALAQDQTLAARVLRLANSAAYAGTQDITNLEVALSRLGMKSIQSLMLKESIKAITIKKTAQGRSRAEVLWKRSVASGVIMENLSYCCQIKPDEAFIAGLLHDIGEMVLLRILHDYQRVTKQKLPAPVIDYIAQECHEKLGGVLAKHWNLPEAIKPLLEHHHGEIDDYDPHKVAKCLLQITDMLCSLMGYGEKYPFDLLNTEPARMIAFGTEKSHIDALQFLPDLVAAEMNQPF